MGPWVMINAGRYNAVFDVAYWAGLALSTRHDLMICRSGSPFNNSPQRRHCCWTIAIDRVFVGQRHCELLKVFGLVTVLRRSLESLALDQGDRRDDQAYRRV
jgi:hypothetical protein